MADSLRAQVRDLYNARCSYCGVHEDAAGATLTVDHHRPRAQGGTDDLENLLYSCVRCNEHKGTYWHERDPPHVRLLHPGQDYLDDHLEERPDARIVGLTREGEFFIRRLRLNRPQLVAYRRWRLLELRMMAELTATYRHAEELERTVIDLRRALELTPAPQDRRSNRLLS